MTTTQITFRHTRADGTLIEGGHKGDGVFEALRTYGFRYFPSLGQIGLPRSRDRQALCDRPRRRGASSRRAHRVERSQQRAGRLEDRAGRAGAASAALRDRADSLAKSIPLGQPIPIGHHSEGRHRRDLDRIHRDTGGDRARELARHADAAEAYERHRNDPAWKLRRIQKLETEARHGDRETARTDNSEQWAVEVERRRAETAEELEHWRGVVAAAETKGLKVWSAADFTKGDFVSVRRGQWHEVLRRKDAHGSGAGRTFSRWSRATPAPTTGTAGPRMTPCSAA